MKRGQVNTNEAKIDELLSRGVAEAIVKEKLKEKLMSGKQLRIKLGIDPTSPHIHIGRAVSLLKLRDFEELGHKIVLIVGDFTGATPVENDVALGSGQINIAAVIKAAKKSAIQYYYIEDESKEVNLQVPVSLAFLKAL